MERYKRRRKSGGKYIVSSAGSYVLPSTSLISTTEDAHHQAYYVRGSLARGIQRLTEGFALTFPDANQDLGKAASVKIDEQQNICVGNYSCGKQSTHNAIVAGHKLYLPGQW